MKAAGTSSFAVALLLAALVAVPAQAHAEGQPRDEKRVEWSPRCRRFRPSEYVGTRLLEAGKSLAEALRLRRTTRETSNRPLDAQLLSDLLFTARGVNRHSGLFGAPGITAASASNSEEI